MLGLNLSFAACGFLGIYHLGAAGALLRHGDRLLRGLGVCAGASAGALVAAVLITAPEKLEECKTFTYKFADEVRKQPLGAITPGYNFMSTLRGGLEDLLPRDAHTLAGDRLHVSLTHSRSGRNTMVSQYGSREELIKVLLASSFIPLYAGTQPLEFRGQTWVDGGFTDGLPILPAGRTITVSPFAGPQDVCPAHAEGSGPHLRLANMAIALSVDNMVRLNQAFFPPPAARMRLYCHEGFSDALRFLEREGWLS